MRKHTCIYNRECFCGAPVEGEPLVGQSSAGWPRVSDSMAVHPKQAKEAYEQSVRLGVPTEFLPTGQPVITDPGHQRRYAKALGYVDLCERNNTSHVHQPR